ncbi:hypothetical protein ASZ90_002322 [hydrocarbon metagenome]|uniref:Uncharacterized protein n=1 Tax=hydrocarbon metagenome TaxID=938273 RepID=A0A0W8G446_9ZZZZ
MDHADGHAARLGEFEGVAHQVDDDLAQPVRVAAQVAGDVRGQIQVQPEPFFGGHDPEGLDRGPQHPGKVEVDVFQVQASGLDLGQIQDVADDAEQVAGRVADGFQVVDLLGLQARGEQEVGQAQDGIEGRPDFMAHARQKVALGSVGLVRLLLGGAQVGHGAAPVHAVGQLFGHREHEVHVFFGVPDAAVEFLDGHHPQNLLAHPDGDAHPDFGQGPGTGHAGHAHDLAGDAQGVGGADDLGQEVAAFEIAEVVLGQGRRQPRQLFHGGQIPVPVAGHIGEIQAVAPAIRQGHVEMVAGHDLAQDAADDGIDFLGLAGTGDDVGDAEEQGGGLLAFPQVFEGALLFGLFPDGEDDMRGQGDGIGPWPEADQAIDLLPGAGMFEPVLPFEGLAAKAVKQPGLSLPFEKRGRQQKAGRSAEDALPGDAQQGGIGVVDQDVTQVLVDDAHEVRGVGPGLFQAAKHVPRRVTVAAGDEGRGRRSQGPGQGADFGKGGVRGPGFDPAHAIAVQGGPAGRFRQVEGGLPAQ